MARLSLSIARGPSPRHAILKAPMNRNRFSARNIAFAVGSTALLAGTIWMVAFKVIEAVNNAAG